MTDTVRTIASVVAAVVLWAAMVWWLILQCRKPRGWMGRAMVWIMNRSHAALVDWGLTHVQVKQGDAVLDVGCGGGRTVQRLARIADTGMVRGADHSETSVAASRALNSEAIAVGRVVIERAEVSRLPFSDDSFDVVTAVETHYYWPKLSDDLREVRRVLKPGGCLAIMAETYRNGRSSRLNQFAMKPAGTVLLTPEQHREAFVGAGYADVQVFLEASKGWICVCGRKS